MDKHAIFIKFLNNNFLETESYTIFDLELLQRNTIIYYSKSTLGLDSGILGYDRYLLHNNVRTRCTTSNLLLLHIKIISYLIFISREG